MLVRHLAAILGVLVLPLSVVHGQVAPLVTASSFAVAPGSFAAARWGYEEPVAISSAAHDRAAYRSNHWKTGALVGTAVGVALGTVLLATCDSDSNDDCPGWGRAGIVLVGSTGIGALIGAFIPSEKPVAAE